MSGFFGPQEINIDPTAESLRPTRDTLARELLSRLLGGQPQSQPFFGGLENPVEQLFPGSFLSQRREGGGVDSNKAKPREGIATPDGFKQGDAGGGGGGGGEDGQQLFSQLPGRSPFEQRGPFGPSPLGQDQFRPPKTDGVISSGSRSINAFQPQFSPNNNFFDAETTPFSTSNDPFDTRQSGGPFSAPLAEGQLDALSGFQQLFNPSPIIQQPAIQQALFRGLSGDPVFTPGQGQTFGQAVREFSTPSAADPFFSQVFGPPPSATGGSRNAFFDKITPQAVPERLNPGDIIDPSKRPDLPPSPPPDLPPPTGGFDPGDAIRDRPTLSPDSGVTQPDGPGLTTPPPSLKPPDPGQDTGIVGDFQDLVDTLGQQGTPTGQPFDAEQFADPNEPFPFTGEIDPSTGIPIGPDGPLSPLFGTGEGLFPTGLDDPRRQAALSFLAARVPGGPGAQGIAGENLRFGGASNLFGSGGPGFASQTSFDKLTRLSESFKSGDLSQEDFTRELLRSLDKRDFAEGLGSGEFALPNFFANPSQEGQFLENQISREDLQGSVSKFDEFLGGLGIEDLLSQLLRSGFRTSSSGQRQSLATGGNIDFSVDTIVGEQGPEIIPAGTSTVVPLTNGGGGEGLFPSPLPPPPINLPIGPTTAGTAPGVQAPAQNVPAAVDGNPVEAILGGPGAQSAALPPPPPVQGLAFADPLSETLPSFQQSFETALSAPQFDLTETFRLGETVFKQDLEDQIARVKEESSRFGFNPGSTDRDRRLVDTAGDALSRFRLGQQGIANQAFEGAEGRRIGALGIGGQAGSFLNTPFQRQIESLPFLQQREQRDIENFFRVTEPAAQRRTGVLGQLPEFSNLPFDQAQGLFDISGQARGVADLDIQRRNQEFARTQGQFFNQILAALGQTPLQNTQFGPSGFSQSTDIISAILPFLL